nr:hypothetical protein [Tanacetum cinerariifolium]
YTGWSLGKKGAQGIIGGKFSWAFVRAEDDIALLETRFDEEAVFVFVFPKDVTGAYTVGNILRYQDLEWYEALKDGKLTDEALKNKAIMEGIIEDDDDESSNEERCELFDDHERPGYNIRRFEMIKYSFGQDEEYLAVKEDEYDV